MDKNKDIFGKAIKAYYESGDETEIIVHSPDFDDDVIAVKYLFRQFREMPKIEQKALELCRGSVLDVGCGAGSHSLHLQTLKNLEVSAIDTSPGSVEIAKKRGVKDVQCKDFFKLTNKKVDTILMLMNGSGIIGKLKNLDHFFNHARAILNEGGSVIMDSTDLIYLFDEEITGFENYYGELEFKISFKNDYSDSFGWLYIDPELLKQYAHKNRFDCEIMNPGDNFDYLAHLTVR